MSNLGMERHEHPDFEYQDLPDADGPSFWWKNPYNGRREKIANLWWPEHPVEATEAIEALFENLKLTYEPCPPGTEPPQSINSELLEAAKEAREALGSLHHAILRLSTIKDGKTLFEGSPSKDQACYEAWVALDGAQKLASKALGDRKTLKLLFTSEWLRKKIDESPDEENCEAGILHPEAPRPMPESPQNELLKAARNLIECIDGYPVSGRIDLSHLSETLVPALRTAISNAEKAI